MNKFAAICLITLSLAGCNESIKNPDEAQRKAQTALAAQSDMAVGMPAIVNFSEKRLLKDIFEMRDKLVPTYTYLASNLNGTIGEKICDSLGFGIPYATQYTNPQKDAYYTSTSQAHVVLPQADPNGLFSPQQADGTWVLCKVPGTDKISPQYIEPKILVLTFPKENRK